MIDYLAGLLVTRIERWEAAHGGDFEMACNTYYIARVLGMSRWKAAMAAWRSRA